MENQVTSLKCRKCGAVVNADQKKCPKCGAPVLLKVMMEEEKRHLSSKEIREKDKRMRREYDKISKEKEQKRQKEEKKKQLLDEKKQKSEIKAKAELDALREKEEKKLLKAEEKKARIEAKKSKKLKKDENKSAEKNAEKGKFPVWAIIVIAVVILAVAGAVLMSYLNQSATEEPYSEPEAVETQTEEPIEEVTEEPSEEPAEEVSQPEAETPSEPVAEEPKEPETEKKPTRNITRNNYLFPSDTQYLTESDLTGLSKYDTGLIRNEIYAKKGYVFKDEPYKSYFNSQAWYNPNPSAKMRLNETEKYNVDFLLQYERSQGWR